MSGLLVTVIVAKVMIPASSSATNKTIGGTGLRMHQDEMLRKFIRVRLSWRDSARGLSLDVDLLAGVQERSGRLNHRFAAGEALADGYAVVVDRADLDRAPLDLVLAVDD